MAAARRMGHAAPPRAVDAARRVEALIERHGAALLRVANQFSLCRDDALDAYQRALEIYLRRLDTVEAATEGAWMRVVVKHEAMAIRQARVGSVDRDEVDVDGTIASAGREVDDHVAGGERVERSVEALRALKPDEARALMLKAEGLSYAEIGKRFGWTYTKVNRSITEGRARFMKAFRGIEAGEACERYAEALAALAGGTATASQIVELRPHLRHCAACRATIRELRVSLRRRLALLLPLPAVLRHLLAGRPPADDGGPAVHLADAADTSADIPGSTAVHFDDPGGLHLPDTPHPDLPAGLHLPHHAGLHLPDLRAAPDLSDLTAASDRLRLLELRHHLTSLVHRVPSSDVATGVQIASASGGGRLSSVAAIVAFCLSGVGAASVCVVSGVVHAPLLVERPKHHHAPPAHHPARDAPHRSTRPASARIPKPPVLARRAPVATATPKPTTTTTTTHRHSHPSTTPHRRPAPTQTESDSQTTAEFGFEGTGSGASASSPPPPPTASTASAGGSSGGSSTSSGSSAPATSGGSGPTADEFGFEGG